MTGCHMWASRRAMGLLIIKENISLIGSKELGFIHAAEKN
jgi:hypothetical protein